MKWTVIFGMMAWCVSLSAVGQTGIQILGNPTLLVQSASDYRNGVSVSHQTVQISALINATITLQVRASGNITLGANNIPLSSLFMQVTSSTPVGTEIQVTTANKTLLTGRLNASVTNRPVTIKYRLASSAALLKPGGSYTTTLTFTFTGL